MFKIVLPLMLGMAAVIQAGMNRRVGASLGVSKATLLNNVVLLSASVVFFILSRPAGPAISSVKTQYSLFTLLLPGLLGLCLVTGIPWAISKWGATIVFVGLIFSQLVASLVWDVAIEHKEIHFLQVAGVLTSMAGAVLVNVRT